YDWDDIIRSVSASFQMEWELSVADLVEKYCHPPHIKLYPGAFQLLSTLSQEGHVLRALTNGYYIYQYPVLRALGIAPFFERIVTPEKLGAAKPQRKFYLAAQKDAPQPHIHVGDTVIHDIWGANRSGAISVWVKHDLPSEWENLTPEKRARDPLITTLVQEGINSDLCPHCHPGLELKEALPHFVINDLSEVEGIITSLVKS
ncbi:MAG: HAD hydrolase-like protein, partial [Firmicutes bacterium]|nr:HAD hydrolase-like protein [Bacillota bacterium]